METDSEASAATFDRLRPRLKRIAYRMLGSVAEAEDVVQDAYLRWHAADRDKVRDPSAFLARIVACLSLDHLKSARVRREHYVGMWLPEPLVESGADETAGDDLTLTLMMALERLSPLERAAFLLHDVFDVPFDEVAQAIGRDPAACRQLAARARAHVKASGPRFDVSEEDGERIARAFFAASSKGDVGALKQLLADGVTMYSDGGGKRPATINPIFGRDKVMRFYAGLAAKTTLAEPRILRSLRIDGLPGYLAMDRFGILHTSALQIDERHITAIYSMRNPDKLQHIAAETADG